MASTWDTNTYDWTKSAGSVFGGSTPSFNSTPSFSVNWGNKLDLPGLSGTGGLYDRNSPLNVGGFSGIGANYQRRNDFNWGGLAKSAVDLAKAWQSQGSGKLGGYEGSRSISGAAGSGGTERRLSPSLTLLEGERRVEQKQSATSGGGGGGIGSAIGTVAGIGASLIPGVGAGIAPFLPTIGSTVGGGIGSLFG